MKFYKTLILLLSVFLLNTMAYCQEESFDFGKMMHTYYLEKDKDLLKHSVEYFNSVSEDTDLSAIVTGFYGGLFLKSPEIRDEFRLALDQFTNTQIKSILHQLTHKDITSILENHPISPSFNDMNWAAYFATGNTNYVENILANCKHAKNRKDLNLFLTGASAQWSLCSNASQDKNVKQFLKTTKNFKKFATQILESDPLELKNKITRIVQEERTKGNWQ